VWTRPHTVASSAIFLAFEIEKGGGGARAVIDVQSAEEEKVADDALKSRVFHEVTTHFVEHGRAPHYTELASLLGITPDAAKETLHELADTSSSTWFIPETEYMQVWAPFSNVPTQHAITVEGEQKWFGLCGPEAFAVSWLFPGKETRINSRCLDCAEPVNAIMKDGVLTALDPADAVAVLTVPLDQIITPFNLDGARSLAFS